MILPNNACSFVGHIIALIFNNNGYVQLRIQTLN